MLSLLILIYRLRRAPRKQQSTYRTYEVTLFIDYMPKLLFYCVPVLPSNVTPFFGDTYFPTFAKPYIEFPLFDNLIDNHKIEFSLCGDSCPLKRSNFSSLSCCIFSHISGRIPREKAHKNITLVLRELLKNSYSPAHLFQTGLL